MDLASVFFVSSIIILLGFLADWLFDRTNIPDVLWLLFVGIALRHILMLTGILDSSLKNPPSED